MESRRGTPEAQRISAIARVGSRLRLPRTSRKRNRVVEIKMPPAPINRAMARIFAAEGGVATRARLPFGGSIVAAYRKHPDDTES